MHARMAQTKRVGRVTKNLPILSLAWVYNVCSGSNAFSSAARTAADLQAGEPQRLDDVLNA